MFDPIGSQPPVSHEAAVRRPVLGVDIGGAGVKVAALCDGVVLWTTKRGYRKPAVDDLIHAIRDALKGRETNFAGVGLCVPGLLDERRTRVTFSVNVPALQEISLDDLAYESLGRRPDSLCIANDSVASGYDIHATRNLPGRLLVLALGTGVGAAVLDDGVALKVDGDSPGHVGQFDVGVEGDPLRGPDGGAGSLEGYIGAPALRHRYGSDPASKIRPGDSPIRALAKAIRICHAIYRPHHVILAGGLGIRLGRLLHPLRQMIEKDLSSIARPGWTLNVGDSDFHAACGAARLAENYDRRNARTLYGESSASHSHKKIS
ncbi:MAG TPA: ROK family protein [Tepidisphaeraceae bacterium]|nr:ROK family protein [Tepidisphaeraceae bacterium]